MLDENISRVKLILLGDTGVGKSAIIKRFHQDKFESDLTSTLCANFIEKEFIIKKKKVILEVWDTAGQETFNSMTKIFVKNSKIIILVYNVTSLKSFEALDYWYDFIIKEIGPNVILGLAGNKTDLIFDADFTEEVSSEKGKEFANKIGASFALVSAKESSKEIKALFNQLLVKYLETQENDINLKGTIKIDEKNFTKEINNKNECCGGKKKKAIKLKAIFLGSSGVGKTSIIKTIKGNDNIYNLQHTKKDYKENIYYKKNNQSITVTLKEINGNEYINSLIENDNDGYKIFFLVFNVFKKNTLYDLQEYITKIKSKKYNIYLLGYDKESSENKTNEYNYIDEVEEFSKKNGCEFEYITVEDIYKVKAIIIDNIGKYLSNLGV